MNACVLRRDLKTLSSSSFDLLVIGGGILGACIARDAALRCLATALVERGDFGSETSSNNLKVVHGGLRYLQYFDLGVAREALRERSVWLRIAPHLVEPLPIAVPTYGHGPAGREALRAGLAIHDLIAWDRNRDLPRGRSLPPGRLLTRRELLELAPELEGSRPNGGVLFYDAQMYSPERLVLEVVQAASQAGAVVANYAEAEGPARPEPPFTATPIRDRVGGGAFSVRAHLIVNAGGPASLGFLERLLGRRTTAFPSYSLAMNLMFPSFGHRVAFALRSGSDSSTPLKGSRRHLFVVPWRGHTLVGTAHYDHRADPATFTLNEQEVTRFLDEVNACWPGRSLRRDETQLVHAGLLPARSISGSSGVRLRRRPLVVDHACEGMPNLVSAVSVKFTTARLLAERTIDLAMRNLGYHPSACLTANQPLPGGIGESPADLAGRAERAWGEALPTDVLQHLLRTYGGRYENVIAVRESRQGWDRRIVASAPVILAQFVHGVREEMAQQPEDLVLRRTELGARGMSSPAAIEAARQVLRSEPASSSVGLRDRMALE